ncbi:MAG: penicillin-binding protein 1A, partial [Gammaproteobacteria bacterium]
LDQLTLAEYAMIAGLPKAPSANNPITNETRALQRRNYVLRRMLELDYISEPEYADAINQPSTAALHYQGAEIAAPYLAEMVRKAIFERYGEQAYTSGLKIYTTISGLLQTTADRALRNTLHGYDQRHGYRPAPTSEDKGNFDELPVIGDTLPAMVLNVKKNQVAAKLQDDTQLVIPWENLKWAAGRRKTIPNLIKAGHIIRVRRLPNKTWALAQVPEVEGAFVALNPADGAVLALSGGFDFFSSNFNRATQSKRQPGSGFKPIIYTAALEAGYTPASILYDEPIVITEDPYRKVEWRPENYNRKYRGPITLRTALVHSSNIVAIRLLDNIGIDNAVSTALRFGFTQKQLPETLSLALGSGYASPLQMAQAYAVFANGGFLVKPYFIERIESGDDKILYQAKPRSACPMCADSRTGAGHYAPRVMARDIHFLMHSLLGDVVQRGTAAGAKILNRQDIAGKTGTTNDHRDAWFNGYTPAIVATAWVGFDNFKSLGNRETGSRTALPMWVEFMRTALANIPETPLTIPHGIAEAFIDPVTGELMHEENNAGTWEFFQADSAPRTEAVVYEDTDERENTNDDNKSEPEDTGEPLH